MATETLPAPKAWIICPAVDLLLICGGAIWILTGLAIWLQDSWLVTSYAMPLALMATISMYVFSNAHTACTWIRIGHTPENRASFKLYTNFLAMFFIGLTLAAWMQPTMVPSLMKIYVLWVVQHYSAQVYGLILIYCMKQNYRLSPLHRHALRWSCLLVAFTAMASELTFKPLTPAEFITPLPFWGPLPEWIFESLRAACVAAFGVFTVFSLGRYIVKGEIFPWPSIMLLATLLMIFAVPYDIRTLMWLFVPPFFHGSQYVLVSASVHLRERGLHNWDGSAKIAALKYAGATIVLGALLYVWIPELCVTLGLSYEYAMGAPFAAANFHHFLTDRAIWRLRDPVTRSYLR